MRLVRPARVAEFLKFKTIRRLLLVLRGDVISILTLSALKRDVISCHNSSTAKLKVYQLN